MRVRGPECGEILNSSLKYSLRCATDAQVLMNNYFVTTNCGLLLSVPDGVTTETVPVVAPAGTVALMKVSDSTVNAASTPLNVTLVVPVRLFPRIRTLDPTLPPVGTVSTSGLRPVEILNTVPSPN